MTHETSTFTMHQLYFHQPLLPSIILIDIIIWPIAAKGQRSISSRNRSTYLCWTSCVNPITKGFSWLHLPYYLTAKMTTRDNYAVLSNVNWINVYLKIHVDIFWCLHNCERLWMHDESNKENFFLQFEMQFYSQAAFLFCCRKISKITILTKTKAET